MGLQGTEVRLSEEERQRAAAAAVAVNENKARLGKPGSYDKYGVDPLESRYQSFCAEAAVAKVLGIPEPEWPVLPGGDGKIDLTTPAGLTVQVKYRGERGRDLATEGLDFWDELRADVYVLVWPSLWGAGSYTVVGWCSREEFFNRILTREPVRMKGRKFEMRWQDMRPMPELVWLTAGEISA